MESANQLLKNIPWGRISLFAILIVMTFLPFVLAINIVDLDNNAIAFDWRQSFHGAIWLENFGWGIRRFQTPPWSVMFLLPFTALSFGLGWAAMMYVTTIALVLAVPRRPSRNKWLVGTLLLLTAHPVLRNFADVNLEGFLIAGVLISLYAFHEKKPYILALGILIAGLKPQGVFLVFIIMGLYMLRTFHWRDIGKVVAVCGCVFIVTMLLWGQVWLESLTLLPAGISLSASLADLGLSTIGISIIRAIVVLVSLIVAYRGEPTLDRAKVGLLIAASVLVAPYANGLSLVTSLAFGGIAIFMSRPWLGIFVFLIYNLPYVQALGVNSFTIEDSLYYMIIQLILWSILLVDVYRDNQPTKRERSTLKEDIQ
ncbi:MAG: glycosyltransferase 87 family protein [Phototrophicaceae bacterium]